MSSKRIIYSQQFSSEVFASGEGYRFRFRQNSYACSTMIIILFRLEFMGNMIVFSSENINVIHFFMVSAFLFLPVMYMFLFIGHYSKLGCLVIPRVIPVVNGVGHTMLVISVIELVHTVAYTTDAMELLYGTIESDMSWAKCSSDLYDGCIGINNMEDCLKQNCFRNISQFSLYRFFKYRLHYLRESTGEVEDHFWKNLSGSRVPYLIISIIIIMIISDLDISANSKFSHIIFFIYLLAIIGFVLMFALNIENSAGVLEVFNIKSHSLINSDCWISTVLGFIEYINMADVSSVLIGSYLPSTSMTDLQAFIMWIGIMVLYSLMEFTVCVMAVVLADKIGTDHAKIKIGNSCHAVSGLLFPQTLASLKYASSPLCCAYFALIIISGLSRIRLILAAAYHTLADARPVIRSYKFYIRIFSSGFLFVLTFPICVTGIQHGFLEMLRYLESALSMLVLVLVTVGVLYIYGVQTLCDDHHFTYGSQPAVFFKVTLFIAPVCFIMVGAMYFLRLSGLYSTNPEVAKYFYVTFPVLVIPQLIGLFYITTYYLKRQNMAHLLRCEDNWGDPNPTTRKERIIYHPRKETNYFRRIDVCKHECLRYNRIFPFIVKDEDHLQKEGYAMLKPNEKIFTDSEVETHQSETSYTKPENVTSY